MWNHCLISVTSFCPRHGVITNRGLELDQTDMQFIQENKNLSKPEVILGQQTQTEGKKCCICK